MNTKQQEFKHSELTEKIIKIFYKLYGKYHNIVYSF